MPGCIGIGNWERSRLNSNSNPSDLEFGIFFSGTSQLSPCMPECIGIGNWECNRIPNSNSNFQWFGIWNCLLGDISTLTMPDCIGIGNWERNRIPNSSPNSKGLKFGIVFSGIFQVSHVAPCQSALELGISERNGIPNSNSNFQWFGIWNCLLGNISTLTICMPECIGIGNWERSQNPNSDSNSNSRELEFGIVLEYHSPFLECVGMLELGMTGVALRSRQVAAALGSD